MHPTSNKLIYVETWLLLFFFVIFKYILYFTATWGIRGPKRQMTITMLSPITNTWNCVQNCSYTVYVYILFWALFEHCSVSYQTFYDLPKSSIFVRPGIQSQTGVFTPPSQVSTQSQNMHKAKWASTSAFPLRKFCTEKIFVLERMQLRKRRHTASEAFKQCNIYTILNFECFKCARMIFHCVDGLVVLRSCTPQRDQRSTYSIIT